MRSKADRSRATPIHFTRRGRCNDYEASPWHGPVYRLPFLDETALGHLERREYQSRPTRDRLRNRSDCLLIGVALLVLPGPAFIVIPIGLAILATEYAWARRWLKRVRRLASSVVSNRGRERPVPEDSKV